MQSWMGGWLAKVRAQVKGAKTNSQVIWSASVATGLPSSSGKIVYEDPLSDESFDALLSLLGKMALRIRAAHKSGGSGKAPSPKR